MSTKEKSYIAIDLKSFYASVECVQRGLDPLDAYLVVADESRTEKTICLAVSPSLKAYGIPGRARLFEVIQRVKEINRERSRRSPSGKLFDTMYLASQTAKNPQAAVGYIIAKPQMARYMEVSTQVVQIYLKYIAPEDMHVYSVDEVFIDATNYLSTYRMTARQLAQTMIREVLETTGITATAGIGTNLYLAKIAMDIGAKHIKADKDGVRIAELDERRYRERLWEHRPLTDFWRVGRGIAAKLEAHGMFTMGDVAQRSIESEDLLYRLFGKNAELLIDHAWGWEPCTIGEIKKYRPRESSLSSGQVLQNPYEFEKARLITREMTDTLALDLVRKHLVTDQLVFDIGYDVENLNDAKRSERYGGETETDRYGRSVPKPAHGSKNLGRHTSSTRLITEKAMELFDEIVDPHLLIRRITVGANHLLFENSPETRKTPCQFDLFSSTEHQAEMLQKEEAALLRERKIQEAVIGIKSRFGKNGILKGMNLKEGATARDRNAQIGGHKA